MQLMSFLNRHKRNHLKEFVPTEICAIKVDKIPYLHKQFLVTRYPKMGIYRL